MASSYQQAVDAIGALVLPAWNTATTSAPLMYPNLDEDPPDGATWGRFSIRMSGGSRANIGPSARFRRTGTAFVQIFVPKNTGMGLAYAIGELMVQAFENAGSVDGNVWFREVALREVGADTGQTVHQVNVEAEFTFDRIT